ncbi:MAG: hypothetical protein RL839_08560 [Gammaproteobacteria bacterium]
MEVTGKIGKLLKEGGINDFKENITELVNQIPESRKSDLAHFIELLSKLVFRQLNQAAA